MREVAKNKKVSEHFENIIPLIITISLPKFWELHTSFGQKELPHISELLL